MRRLLTALLAAAAIAVVPGTASAHGRSANGDRADSGSQQSRHRHHHRHHRRHHGQDDTRRAESGRRGRHDEQDHRATECGGSTVSGHDREWLLSSIQGDHFEITGGRYAMDHTAHAATRDLGNRLVADHTKSLEQMTALAGRLGVPVPGSMSTEQAHELADVTRTTGMHFDDEYTELEVKDHRQDIAEATSEWTDGCNAEVRNLAHDELPVLHDHLTMSDHVHTTVEAVPGHDSDTRERDESTDHPPTTDVPPTTVPTPPTTQPVPPTTAPMPEPTPAPAPECGSSGMSDHDREWLISSIQGDHFEIAGGRYAMDHAAHAATRDLGSRLVADHTKSLDETTALAERLGVTPPTTMSAKQASELADVTRHTGLHFDDEYSELEVTDHHQDIDEATTEWNHGCNTDVRNLAHDEIPVLSDHLTMSEHTHTTIEAIPDHDSDASSTTGAAADPVDG